MNFKLFTSALLATAATAQATGQTSALGDSLQAKYQDMPEHVQRRFWVRILSLRIKKAINTLFSMHWLQTLHMQLSTIISVKSLDCSKSGRIKPQNHELFCVFLKPRINC